MSIIINVLFFLEILFFILIVKKKTIIHPYSITYFVAFFYIKSVYIDNLLFNFTPTFVFAKSINVAFSSYYFLEYCIITFMFLLTFYVLVTIENKFYQVKNNNLLNKINITFSKRHFFYVILIVFTLYNIYETSFSFSLTRIEKGENQTATTLLFRNLINYSFILFFCLKKEFNYLFKIFFISNIIYFIFSFEREPFIILFLSILYKYDQFKNTKYVALGTFLLIIIMFTYKNFYSTIIYTSNNSNNKTENFISNIENSKFTFSGLDPQSSFLLVYDYLEKPEIYSEYNFTYFTGVYEQLIRFFIKSDYKTLAEYSSDYYVNGDYGTASSFLLESLLNFSYFGPVFIAIFIFYFLRKAITYKEKYGFGIIVSAIYIITKLMRTELATILKLQVLPLLIAIFIFSLIIKKPKKNESIKNKYLYSHL